jgi:hypothetical protein
MSEIPQWLKDDSEVRKKSDQSKVSQLGLKFLSNVVSRLEANVEHLGSVGAQGRLSNLTRPDEQELRYRLDIRVNRVIPSLTYTDLFYMPGTLLIRCRPRDGWATDFHLCLLEDGEVGVIADGEFSQMDSPNFGDWIVKSAIERLREVA